MELVNAANTVGSEFIDALCDPFCTVTCDNLNACTLFFGELLIEFFKHRFPVTEGNPHHSVRVMIDDDSDVLMPLFVACLIYSDVDKIVQSMRDFRFDHIFCTADTSAHSFPIDTEILRNNAAWKMHCKPSCCQVKILCEAAAGIRPRNISNNYSVLKTLNPMRLVFNLNKCCAPVKSSPNAGFPATGIISRTASVTVRAFVFVPLARTCLNANVVDAIGIRVEFAACDDCILKIKQLLAERLGRFHIQEYLRCGKSRVCTLTFYRIGKVPAMRPPPLTEPERNAVKSLPTVTNGGTAQQVHRRSVIVAFLSEPVKGKPPYGGGWFCLRF